MSESGNIGRGRGRGKKPKEPTKAPGKNEEESVSQITGATTSLSLGSQQPSTKPKYQEEDEKKFEEEEITEERQLTQAMKRPGIGTKGSPVQLVANYYPVTIPKDLTVYQYDMNFETEWFASKASTLPEDPNKKKKQLPSANYIAMERRIFWRPDPRDMYPLGNGLIRYPGFWQSIRPVSNWKIMLNLDQANAAFVKSGTLLDVLYDMRLDPKQVTPDKFPLIIRKLDKLLKGLKIVQTQRHNQRTAKYISVSTKSAAQLTFPATMTDGKTKETREISVADYFRSMFNKKEFVKNIQYPNLPCLHLGSKDKKNYIPLEFCEIKEGQKYGKKLDGDQTSKMLKYATQPAFERRNKIQEDAKFLNYNEDPYMKEFEFTVSMQMAPVKGRVLDAPRIAYGNRQEILPEKGFWNMRDKSVISGCNVQTYVVVSSLSVQCIDDKTIGNFCFQLSKIAGNMGVNVAKSPAKSPLRCENFLEFGQCLQFIKQKVPNINLVIVILDGPAIEYYNTVKHQGDVVLGMNTQCVQLKNVLATQNSTLANICIKINSKLGGVNSQLAENNKSEIKTFFQEPILFLGADVNHPSALEKDDPISCAAVVGNVDRYPSAYTSQIFLQNREEHKMVYNKMTERQEYVSTRRPQEWIKDMKDAVKKSIYYFAERNRLLPRRIVMYRDGVGETMFLKVLTHELQAIREACTESAENPTLAPYVKSSGFKAAYEPPITFIIVQKRHHTRLFPVNSKDAGRNGNVKPGTTVDTEIVNPEEFDFFLCSHQALQGTSKPCHYHVVWDDSNFSPDDLQTLTYYLCHTYARATCSVSYPPPCYYADLVAYRARRYLSARMGFGETASQTSSGSSSAVSTVSDLKRLQQEVEVKLDIVKRGMFFV